MGDSDADQLPLRHPAENPMFILMVVLNFAILGVLICFLVSTALIPPSLRDTNWEETIRAIAAVILLVAPGILLVRQIQRASIRGTAVQLSRTQFPDLYASMDDFAATLRVEPTPAVYLSYGNGTSLLKIGQEIGLSQSRVSQIRSNCFERLRQAADTYLSQTRA